MAPFVHTASLIALVLLLLVAAAGDARRFIIPNGLCLAIAALAAPYWLSGPDALWPMIGWQLLFALAVFMIFA
jgi:Flp pilus assembly protein protease CpaA